MEETKNVCKVLMGKSLRRRRKREDRRWMELGQNRVQWPTLIFRVQKFMFCYSSIL
jgi:hypothetical protein